MPPIEFLGGAIDVDQTNLHDARVSRRMPQVFGHLKPSLCFIVIVIACLSFADRSARGEYLSPGNHRVTLTHGTRERSAIVHVPLRALDAREIPVIVNFHGGGGSALACSGL